MFKYFLIPAFLLFTNSSTYSQKVNLSLVSPRELRGRKAVLLTREKGFAAIVHSVKLGSDTIHLDLAQDLLPDLYQLHVSQVSGSLFFFLESGTQIKLDTVDLSQSVVTKSGSNPDWQLFSERIQMPSDKRLKVFSVGEKEARRKNDTDSLNYWVEKQLAEKQDLMNKTGEFISAHPASYVSLYLLKANWFAFQDKGMFEKLDISMAGHRNYRLLKGRRRGIAATNGK
ncbi:DUF4369 domain-containing protein [Dyadobacter psychrotolerans]|uniref:DUF4369 domain-containing protein n=1 Tax=Dyadobacter psychrotolerans TaxID=2541721 RepID=A0A4R5E111_9BACT|nr:DUF4369 domain-containing protein [Dyadobacter psychrotolerans]TDE18670.1 hypothetical protein E0F88_03795 [Dyadobacter psychrotolerans]